MMNKILAQKIVKACYLKGNFKLRSGLTSKEYFDKYAIESDPLLLTELTNCLLPLIPKETELLGGLEMGGIPLTTALSLKSQIPSRFIRKQAKDYGTRRLCEGGEVKGKKICLIEDVITTGGQVIKSTEELRALGAEVSHVLCVIFRGENLQVLEKAQLKVQWVFKKEDLIF